MYLRNNALSHDSQYLVKGIFSLLSPLHKCIYGLVASFEYRPCPFTIDLTCTVPHPPASPLDSNILGVVWVNFWVTGEFWMLQLPVVVKRLSPCFWSVIDSSVFVGVSLPSAHLFLEYKWYMSCFKFSAQSREGRPMFSSFRWWNLYKAGTIIQVPNWPPGNYPGHDHSTTPSTIPRLGLLHLFGIWAVLAI